jgi:hypothetical protein
LAQTADVADDPLRIVWPTKQKRSLKNSKSLKSLKSLSDPKRAPPMTANPGVHLDVSGNTRSEDLSSHDRSAAVLNASEPDKPAAHIELPLKKKMMRPRATMKFPCLSLIFFRLESENANDSHDEQILG